MTKKELGKFVKVTKCGRDYFVVQLVIGVQSFRIGWRSTKDEAQWLKRQLVIALQNLIAEDHQ